MKFYFLKKYRVCLAKKLLIDNFHIHYIWIGYELGCKSMFLITFRYGELHSLGYIFNGFYYVEKKTSVIKIIVRM